MLSNFACALLLASIASFGHSARILTVFPMVSKSHFAVGEAITVGLAQRGHQVTLVSPFAYKTDLANLEVVQLTGALEVAAERMKKLDSIDKFNIAVPALLGLLFWDTSDASNFTLQHPSVRRLLAERQYDLVIVEIFVSESLIGLGQHFGAPVIAVSTFGASKWTADLNGSPSPLSYVPHAFSTFAQRMTFVQRTQNTLLAAYENLLMAVLNEPVQQRIYDAAFPDARLSYAQAKTNVSLVLLNSHHSINGPRPYLPNMIEVGGMHVKRTAGELPERLRRFVESPAAEKSGVIYFSLGSMVTSAMMSAQTRQIFARVFAELPQQIIWKFEEAEADGMPANVLLERWVPQADLLAHRNVRLFVTHGGLLSTTESVFHAVPIVGMPLFGDQMRNVQGAVQSGWAVQLDYKNVTEESLRWALQRALGDERIAETARDVSKRFRDQPMTPLETAVYWSEYVIRHGGAAHLRSASLDLDFVQYNNLDVYAALLASWALLFGLFVWLLRRWLNRRAVAKATKKHQ